MVVFTVTPEMHMNFGVIVQVWILTFNENENSLTFARRVFDALRTLKDVGEGVSDPSPSHCGRVQNR